MEANQISSVRVPAGTVLPPQTNPPNRILVVDSDPYQCHLSADVLIRHGFEVNAAEDVAAGWEELQVNHYNLLITEHDHPKLTGLKLVRRLRAARLALPVVLIAGRLPARELSRGPALQLSATLFKPLALDALLATVRRVLRATDCVREPIVPPADLHAAPPTRGWQRRMTVTKAAAAQAPEDIFENHGVYSHWGLNE